MASNTKISQAIRALHAFGPFRFISDLVRGDSGLLLSCMAVIAVYHIGSNWLDEREADRDLSIAISRAAIAKTEAEIIKVNIEAMGGYDNYLRHIKEKNIHQCRNTRSCSMKGEQ